MNQTDQHNLRFLLSCDKEQLRHWYNTASEEDLRYASELMDRYAHYLEWEIQAQRIEKEILAMPVLTEAQAVIAMVSDR